MGPNEESRRLLAQSIQALRKRPQAALAGVQQKPGEALQPGNRPLGDGEALKAWAEAEKLCSTCYWHSYDHKRVAGACRKPGVEHGQQYIGAVQNRGIGGECGPLAANYVYDAERANAKLEALYERTRGRTVHISRYLADANAETAKRVAGELVSVERAIATTTSDLDRRQYKLLRKHLRTLTNVLRTLDAFTAKD